MKRQAIRFFLVSALAALTLCAMAGAQPVYAAGTEYYITSVTCNGTTNTITINGYFNPATPNDGASATVYVNGTPLGTFISGYASFPVTDPSFKIGDLILVTNTSNTTNPTTMASTTCTSGGAFCPFTDGRLNNCDADQTAAVYCDGTGGVIIYVVDHGIGYYDYHLTYAQLNQHPAQSHNTLIMDSMGAFLYRLTDGTLQVNRVKPDGKYYVFRWPNCG